MVQKVRYAFAEIASHGHDREYASALATYLALIVDMQAAFSNVGARWENTSQLVKQIFARQALPIMWDYAEVNPFSGSTGTISAGMTYYVSVLHQAALLQEAATVVQGSAAAVSSFSTDGMAAVVTDPPYYDNVPYADLSDFFYVWLKRTVGHLHMDLLATPLTPKSEEAIQEPMRHQRSSEKAKLFYEDMMRSAFREVHHVMAPYGVATIVFAHKTTEAWETLVNALIQAGLVPTSSWPIHTEMGARLRARESAALASSFFLACRKREGNETAYYKDIKHELNKRIVERLDHFWEQGIRGADFFISAIGPAVEVFGQYEKVKKLSGEEVSVAELLNEVRGQVTEYALSKILHGVRLEKIDPLSRFYVLWRWTYNGETVPYDDARKLAQAVGIEVDSVRGRGKLVSGKDKIVVAKPEQRDVDELARRQPVSMIDALHKACLLWKADKRKELEKFLADVGLLDEPTFWEMAQALSELLPDGDKEKQMIQGLLMRAPTMRREAGRQLSLDERWKA